MAAKADETPDAPAARSRGRLRWLLGWVIVPVGFVAALFLSGVHVGARHPDMWMSRAVLWLFDAEAQRPPEGPPVPLARRLRLAVLPSTGHSSKVELDAAELAAFVERGLGPSPTELDCAKVCRALWQADHPKREFLDAESCTLTPPSDTRTHATLECEARVQRGSEPAP